jgi:hypothetical protein
MANDKLIPVRYVGNKPRARDNVLFRPRLWWDGNGDVKWVPLDDARAYIAYEDQWEVAEDLLSVQVNPFTGKPLTSFAPAADPSTDPLPVGETTDGEAAGADPHDVGVPSALLEMTEVERSARLDKIIRAYPRLSRKDFQADGRPRAAALTRVLNFQVYALERDLAHDAIQESLRDAETRNGAAEALSTE